MPYFARTGVHRLVTLSLLLAISIAIRMAENTIPLPLPLIGAKLGLANSITIVAFYLFGLRHTALLVATRILLAALLAGTIFAPGFLIGTSGAILSLLVMGAGFYSKLFSPLGIGILGAASHNCGQLLAAVILMESQSIFSYLPLLLLFSIPMGLVTGSIAKMVLRLLQQNYR